MRQKFQSHDESPHCAVCFRLPDGQRLEHSFSVNVTIQASTCMHGMKTCIQPPKSTYFLILPAFVMQELYEYVFSTGLIEGSFTLCTAFPRKDMMPSELPVGDCGVVTVEVRDDSPELLATFGDLLSTSSSSVVREHIGYGAAASFCFNVIFPFMAISRMPSTYICISSTCRCMMTLQWGRKCKMVSTMWLCAYDE